MSWSVINNYISGKIFKISRKNYFNLIYWFTVSIFWIDSRMVAKKKKNEKKYHLSWLRKL